MSEGRKRKAMMLSSDGGDDNAREKKSRKNNILAWIDCWKKQCIDNGLYLYGEQTKYTFQTPRTDQYLRNSKPVQFSRTKTHGVDKPCVMTERTHHLIQGPYNIEDGKDQLSVQQMVQCIEKLRKVGYLDPMEDYNTAQVVLESKSQPNNAWLMYGYGRHPGVESLQSRLEEHWGMYSAIQRPHHVLISLMLKRLLNVADNHLDYLLEENGDVFLMGLDRVRVQASGVSEHNDDGDVDAATTKSLSPYTKWFDVGNIVNKDHETAFEFLKSNLGKKAVECLEYMELYGERVRNAFGCGSTEVKTWRSMQVDFAAEFAREDGAIKVPNPERFGWPVQEGQRVMFRPTGGHSDLRPGTIIGNYKNSLHWPLDRCVFADLLRNICPDDCSRQFLYKSEQHVDRIEVSASHVRPMTQEEEKTSLFPAEHFNRVTDEKDNSSFRSAHTRAYFCGDIVKIYDTPVNEEMPSGFSSYTVKRDEKRLQASPDDIGLVMDSETPNEYWKLVYRWKAKKMDSIQCSHLYWVPDATRCGRALCIPNAKEKLEEDAPRKLLRAYESQFRHLLL